VVCDGGEGQLRASVSDENSESNIILSLYTQTKQQPGQNNQNQKVKKKKCSKTWL
jgi:hypothetical protein